jgi:hypothetical protein
MGRGLILSVLTVTMEILLVEMDEIIYELKKLDGHEVEEQVLQLILVVRCEEMGRDLTPTHGIEMMETA